MILIFKEKTNIGKLNQIDFILLDMARKLNSIKKKYNIYRLNLIDDFDKVYIFLSDINRFNYDTYLKEISCAFRKELRDNQLYLKKISENEWEIMSEKLKLLIDKDREKIALKMGNHFVVLNNTSILCFDNLEKLEQKVYKDNKEYTLYQVPKPEQIQRIIPNYLNNNLDEYEIDEYLVNVKLI